MKGVLSRSGFHVSTSRATAHEALALVLTWPRYHYETERELRDLIAEYFVSQGMTRVARNVPLSTGETTDFFAGGTAIIVRLEGTTAEILLSFADVAAAREVAAILLVTDRPRVAPPSLGGKPFIVVLAERRP